VQAAQILGIPIKKAVKPAVYYLDIEEVLPAFWRRQGILALTDAVEPCRGAAIINIRGVLDLAGKDEEGAAREVVTSLWFVAFGPMGEAISRNSRKGDQLIVEARVRANTWTDKQGEKQYDHTFVVQGFRFGAPGRRTREEFSQSAAQGNSSGS
jgi:Single-strand binding protein family